MHFRFFFVNRRTWIVLGHILVLSVFVLCFIGSSLGSSTPQASAQTANSAVANQPAKGQNNPFPHGACTWWAAQRYHQLTGIYVPWRTQSNAWQWTARAKQFHWKVSSKPSKGAIIDLQPWVQGAYGLGHVGVVEQVLKNGHIIVSNMSWGAHPTQVTKVQFAPGRGVTFLSY
ncbi:MAG TPA: CHAP domain-containing protein [Ktedonobacteraceae bacterium]|nr:CHAP domain-containing protein [Ktedonobacteraceae bacterium]